MGALWAFQDVMTAARRNREAIIGRLLMPMYDVDNAAAVKVDTKPLDGQLLASSVGDLYTAPSTAGSFVQIHSITLRNTSGSSVTGVRIYLVPSGGSSGAAETIFFDTIPAGVTVVLAPFGGWFIGASAKIRGLAGTASVIAMRAEVSEWAAQPGGLVLKVIDGVALGTSFSTIYTAPTVQHALLLNYTLCNTDTSDRTPLITLVESGDTSSAEDEIFGDVVPIKTTTIDDTPRVLQTSDFIQGKCAAAASVVSCRLTVLEAA